MTTTNKTLPLLIGKKVELVNLNTKTQFNGKFGKVIGFNEKHQRFIVNLDENCENKTKLLKACNLMPLSCSDGLSIEVVSKIEALESVKIVEEGLEIVNWLQENRSGNASEFEILKKFEWLKKLEKCFFTTPGANEDMEQWYEYILMESKNIPDVYIFILLQAPLFCRNTSWYERLVTHMHDHYGFLPEIVGYLISGVLKKEPGTKRIFKNVFKMYDQAKGFMKTENWDSRITKDLDVFHALALGLFTSLPKAYLQQVDLEIKFLQDKLIQNNCEEKKVVCFDVGKSFFVQDNFEQALFYFKLYLEQAYFMLGSDQKVIYDSLHHMIRCYIKLGRKKDVKKCMRQLKKFGTVDPEIKIMYEKMVENENSKIKNSTSDLEQLTFERNLKKCSYCYCLTSESKIGEFKKCDLCLRAYYCSKKCQILDWKREHKHTCCKDIYEPKMKRYL